MEPSKIVAEKTDANSLKKNSPSIINLNFLKPVKITQPAVSKPVMRPTKPVEIKKPVRSNQLPGINKETVVRPKIPEQSNVKLRKVFDRAAVKKNDPVKEKVGVVKYNIVAKKIKVNCDLKGLDLFKRDVKTYLHNILKLIFDSLDALKNSSEAIGDNAFQPLDGTCAIDDLKNRLKLENSYALNNILRQIEGLEPYTKSSENLEANAELKAKVENLLKEIDELRINLETTQKELTTTKGIDEEKQNKLKKVLEEKDKTIINQHVEYDKLKKKLESVEEENVKEKMSHKDLQNKLDESTAEMEILKKKVTAFVQSEVTQQLKEQEYKNQIKNLETELLVALNDVENRAHAEYTLGDQAFHDMMSLKTHLANCQEEKTKLDNEVEVLKKKIELCTENRTELMKHKDRARHLELENQNLCQTVKDLENKIQANEGMIIVSKETYDGLNKLKKSECEKTDQINDLEKKIATVHFVNQKLEEKLLINENLLNLRCNLIESLQAKESAQKLRLDGLSVEIGQRNNDVQMLQMELLAQAEELQSLYATLRRKNFEITRQEHVVEILLQSNERVQTLRVKQEAKIGQLEEEADHMKETITRYQDTILPNDVLRNNLLLAEAYRDDEYYNNLGYFADDCHRKRHIDFAVKKYET